MNVACLLKLTMPLVGIKTLIGRRFHKSFTLSGISQMLAATAGVTRSLHGGRPSATTRP